MKQQKQFKKEIRLWAGKAYERLLNKALQELDDAFGQWRANHLSPWEHMIALAVYEKVLDPDELPPGIWEHIHPRVDLLQRTEAEIAEKK